MELMSPGDPPSPLDWNVLDWQVAMKRDVRYRRHCESFLPVVGTFREEKDAHCTGRNMNGWDDLYEQCSLAAGRVADRFSVSLYGSWRLTL